MLVFLVISRAPAFHAKLQIFVHILLKQMLSKNCKELNKNLKKRLNPVVSRVYSSEQKCYRSRNDDEYTCRNILFSNSWTKSLTVARDLAN